MVNEAKKPGVFNIVNAVKGRAFPESFLDIYLDESLAFILSELDEALSEAGKSIDGKKALSKKEVDAFEKRRDEILDRKNELIEQMGGAKYVFHIKGISEGSRQDIYDKTVEKFPIEYEKNRNPFTGALEKEEIEEVDRDRYFSDLLWQAHIVKIVAPDGDEQDGISLEDATELRRSLPAASVAKISEGIEKLRIASAAFMMSINEDFLAKS
jgi:3-dehydroquinate dehydratase